MIDDDLTYAPGLPFDETLVEGMMTEAVAAAETLDADEISELWDLFCAIDDTWGGDAVRVEDMASRWREFIHEKTTTSPSYLHEYRAACRLIAELRQIRGEQLYEFLFFDRAVTAETGSPLDRLKRNVIDEFIRVYVCSGGFRSYGGVNYRGFVSGSRYRAVSPYRVAGEK